MTKSKSLSLASSRNPSPQGTFFFLVFANMSRWKHVIEPAAGFRMETILLAFFVSFLPSSFQTSRPPAFQVVRPALSQARKIIYPSSFSCQYPEPCFFLFFPDFFSTRRAPVPHPSEAERKIKYHTLSELSR